MRTLTALLVFILYFLQLSYSSLIFNNSSYQTFPAIIRDTIDCLPSPPSIQGKIYIMSCKDELPNEFTEDFILVLKLNLTHYCSDFNTNDVAEYFENQYVLAIVVLDSLTLYPLRYDYRNCQEALTKQVHYVDSEIAETLEDLLKEGDIISLTWEPTIWQDPNEVKKVTIFHSVFLALDLLFIVLLIVTSFVGPTKFQIGKNLTTLIRLGLISILLVQTIQLIIRIKLGFISVPAVVLGAIVQALGFFYFSVLLLNWLDIAVKMTKFGSPILWKITRYVSIVNCVAIDLLLLLGVFAPLYKVTFTQLLVNVILIAIFLIIFGISFGIIYFHLRSASNSSFVIKKLTIIAFLTEVGFIIVSIFAVLGLQLQNINPAYYIGLNAVYYISIYTLLASLFILVSIHKKAARMTEMQIASGVEME